MKIKSILFALVVFASFMTWNCKKDKLDGIEHINFGYINFSWGANCQRYHLTHENLYATTHECNPGDSSLIDYDVPLSTDKFEQEKHLLLDLPEEIFTSAETNFETNCADCGTYYLEIKKDGAVRYLYFTEAFNKDWPTYAQSTYTLMADAVRDLQ